MKSLAVAILFVSTVSCAEKLEHRQPTRSQASVEATESELHKQFLKETGISLGQYELAKNSKLDCWDGPLNVFDFGTDLTLMMGPHALAIEIGGKKFEEKVSDCVYTYESKYNKNKVLEIREQICSKEPKKTVKTETIIGKNKLEYTRTIYLDDKQTYKFTCTATKSSS
jgi:hypothetical protein